MTATCEICNGIDPDCAACEESRTKIKSRLPGAIMHNPNCGACHEETQHDGDDFYCEGCGIGYSSRDPEQPGWYRDEETTPCGATSTNESYEKLHANSRWYRFINHPCPLPRGHASTGPWDDGHHFPGEAIEIEPQESGATE